MLKRVEQLKKLPVYPRLEYITAEEYLRQFDAKDLESLPVWKDELYLEYHRGTYTTQARVKENNRRSENLLAQAECFSSLAGLAGLDYPGRDFITAWRKVLFNQFHDILPGSSIRPVYQDAEEDHAEVQDTAAGALDKSLEFLGRRIDTSGLKQGRPLVIFNSLSWPVSSLVEVPVDKKKPFVSIEDSRGKKIPSQLIRESDDKLKTIFMAKDIPSLGYACYQLSGERASASSFVRSRGGPRPGGGLKAGEYYLENSFLRVELDRKTGLIASIYDKKSKRNVLDGPEGNLLQLLEDKPRCCESWNIGLTGRLWELRDLDSLEIVETGPVRAVLRVRKSFRGPAKRKFYPQVFESTPGTEYPSSFFIQDIILYRDRKIVDFCTQVDWWEDRLLLKVSFPVKVRSNKATYEIPYGHIRRPTTMNNSREKAMFEVPSINWADLSGAGYGVSILSRSKYGYDIHGNLMRLTLLKSPASPDPTSTPDPLADRGKHTIRYALLPHSGDWKKANVPGRGWEYNVPLRTVRTGRHKGKMAASGSFIQVSPAQVILAGIKKAEDSQDLVLRLYESQGKKATARLRFFRPPQEVHRADIMERSEGRINPRGKQVEIKIAANEIVTLLVKF
jgi:alpha-mannosidase